TRGIILRVTEQPIDTSTASGKCFFDMLGVFAEFETNLRKERQLEGIAKAKAAGVYKGASARSPSTRSGSSRKPAARSRRSPRRSMFPGRRSITPWAPPNRADAAKIRKTGAAAGATKTGKPNAK